MSELTLYTNPMSRGRIARWMLEEIGEPYNVEILDFGPPMKNDEYCAINPMGKVPALRHGSHVVTEAAAICAYLADTFPQAGLAPRPEERADYYRWMFFAAGPVEAALTNHALGLEPPAEKSRMVGYGTYTSVLDALEKAVSRHPYIAGERFTAADVYVGSQVSWGLGFGTLEPRPAFTAYAQRLKQRQALARANELDDAAAQSMKKASS
ncbi:glutathione S-transferase family protein [Phyllobacterium leguminum]|uniref:Glutathione S-transferase n=1 Tax=Phyllobacterium leguminum TaxID=314237 RepID=A0A318T8X5_9HYPH|nr:glutathione S-transferase family protein [Phyllobacterium leguminum]PYE89761.1 glutathione S-transferase [Phyllobacterium leguminum]